MGKAVKAFFKGFFEKKLIGWLASAGIALILNSFFKRDIWWFLTLVLNSFGMDIEPGENSITLSTSIIQAIFGLILIGVAFWFYFKNKEKKPSKTMHRIWHSSVEVANYSNVSEDLSDYTIIDHDISLREEMKTIDEKSLGLAVSIQGSKVSQINNKQDGINQGELSYWGLAHIPLMFQLAYQIADKTSTSFYELNQNKGQWEKVDYNTKKFPELTISENAPNDKTIQTDVIIKISVTHKVEDYQVDSIAGLEGINRFNLQIPHPERNAVISKNQLDDYKDKFRKLLDNIRTSYPKLERIHIFYSGQPSLAFRLGSAISERDESNKDIWVYNFVGTRYNWKLKLHKEHSESEFEILKEENV
ncbi:SAVED domain-containing protein [Rossellomorea marisflavi]|uniref:SAVED domain-containing protein n=1 Tax=Rossellomorea marisflavi TaxID=189381 RepID=UPI003FA10144